MPLKSFRLAALGLWLAGACAFAAPAERPNVLIVNYDDQSWFECSAYGERTIPTPHFDRVAREGALFQVCYASAPSCAPSRAALLAGRNFWELEQGAFIQAWMPTRFPLLPQLLDAAGYHTGYTGKGWGPGLGPPGENVGNPAGKPYNQKRLSAPEEGIAPHDYAANLDAFLAKCPDDQPFFFWAGVIEPHAPHAKDNDQKLYALGYTAADVYVPPFVPDTPATRTERARYAYEVRDGDNTLGKLLASLEKAGCLENTLIIVTADNGTSLPGGKASLYDPGLRVPLAIRWPGRVQPGRVIDDPVSQIDFAPTILELAGAPVPAEMSGRSLVNLLSAEGSGQIDPARTFTVGGMEWHGIENAGRTIRETRYQYVENHSTGPIYGYDQPTHKQYPEGEYERLSAILPLQKIITGFSTRSEIAPFYRKLRGPRPREELYDLATDPAQLHNLADDPAHAAIKERLRDQLHAYLSRTGDPRATGEMSLFEETLKFVSDRKAAGYKD